MPAIGIGGKSITAGCLLLCVAGLLLLYFFSQAAGRTSPVGAKFSNDGASVIFEGQIGKITQKQTGCTISVCDFSGCISVFMQQELADCALFGEGQTIAVEGKVRRLEAGSKFVQASKITPK